MTSKIIREFLHISSLRSRKWDFLAQFHPQCIIFYLLVFFLFFFSIFRECKYEQDLEFSATSRQLNYRRAKEERQKKIKRLKQLQKIQQGQKRRTMKRVNALHIRCALYTTVGNNHSKLCGQFSV